MKYKLLCIDVDGTLACDDKSISRQNIEALKKADKAGIRIAIASGRTPNSLEMLEVAGLAVAMKNATKTIREKADVISDFDNNHYGVADVIEKYIL